MNAFVVNNAFSGPSSYSFGFLNSVSFSYSWSSTPYKMIGIEVKSTLKSYVSQFS